MVLAVTEHDSSEEWILDSGCSYHMCPNKDWIANYQSLNGGKILLGNNASCKVVGISTLKIKMFDGIVRALTDVRQVPDLRKNLISLGTLDSKGYTYRDGGESIRVSNDALVVMKGKKVNSLYTLEGSTVTSTTSVLAMSDSDVTKL